MEVTLEECVTTGGAKPTPRTEASINYSQSSKTHDRKCRRFASSPEMATFSELSRVGESNPGTHKEHGRWRAALAATAERAKSTDKASVKTASVEDIHTKMEAPSDVRTPVHRGYLSERYFGQSPSC